MKRKVSIFLLLFALVCLCFGFTACGGKENGKKSFVCEVISSTQTEVVISVSQATGDCVLLDCMQTLQENGELTYSLSGGMVVQINGISNGGSSYWLLYTSDTEFSNTSWGEVEYDGQSYASAILGVESLPVQGGQIYIWSYQTM